MKHWIGIATLLAWAVPAACLAESAKPLIQIGVEVVEVDEQKTLQLGVEWFSRMLVAEQPAAALLKVGAFARTQISAELQALLEHGAADLLANPKLVTRDSSTATFHAGGELPYAVPISRDVINVEFKPYGVKLEIRPKLQADNRILLDLIAEVSAIDTQNGVTVAGSVLPGIRTRKISSQLTLAPGSTLTLAGLIQTEKEWKRRGVPGLMRIPLLGYLFSRKIQTSRRTSIVVFVTPTILEGGDIHDKTAWLQD